jgi:hypothetical protein
MKKVMLLCGMLIAMSAVTANAAGLSLRWNACLTDGGVANKTSACTSSLGNAGSLVATFNTDADVVGATGIEVIIDLASAGAAWPAWWSTACRTPITMNSAVSVAAANCFDWSSGTSVGGLASFTNGLYYGPTSGRILGGFAVPPGGVDVPALPANTGTEFFAFNVVVSNAKTTGTGLCDGCLTPVCLVFNNIKMVSGLVTSAILNAPATPGSNVATWQGGAGVSSTLGNNCPAATPTKNTTWGSVKSLYR